METAIELVGLGLVDSVVPRGALESLRRMMPHDLGCVSLEPRMYDTLAIVHRRGAVLSPATRLMIQLATERVRTVAEPL